MASPPPAAAGPAWESVRVALPGDVEVNGFRDRAGVEMDLRVLPRPAVVVVIGLGEDPLAIVDTAGRRSVGAFAAGLSPGPARVHGVAVECVEIHLSPLVAHPVLRAAPSDLDGAMVDLSDLWGPASDRLREQLAGAVRWDERVAITERFLASRLPAAAPVDPEVAASWRLILERRGLVRVGDLAASCGWSRKRLGSRFTAQIGLTPKRAAMLVRFDHAARSLRSGRAIADVAARGGYVDQSHLHRDAARFAGCTPAVLAADSTTGDDAEAGPGTFVQDTPR